MVVTAAPRCQSLETKLTWMLDEPPSFLKSAGSEVDSCSKFRGNTASKQNLLGGETRGAFPGEHGRPFLDLVKVVEGVRKTDEGAVGAAVVCGLRAIAAAAVTKAARTAFTPEPRDCRPFPVSASSIRWTCG